MGVVEIIQLYKCFCDVQRLRILNLLREGPLCVCHLVEILKSDQVKISKQLRYMKGLKMVEGERCAQWMIYRLTDAENPLLNENLKCLQDCYGEDTSFREDVEARRRLAVRIAEEAPCCAPAINES